MEQLENGEVNIEELKFPSEIPQSAFDSEKIEDAGGDFTVPSGIYKAFDNIMYNQLDIDPYSCTLVGSFTGISNYTGQTVPLEVMQSAFEDYKASGKFTQGVGGLGTDGAYFACKAYNEHFGTNIQPVTVSFNVEHLYSALQSGSPLCCGIHYGKNFFTTEQTGAITESAGVIGTGGHWITFVKLNTTDPSFNQVKYVENYNGKITYQVIYIQDFDKLQKDGLFFNNGTYFTGK